MTQYSFVTTWQLETPIETVWDAIVEPAQWHSNWAYVDRVVDLQKGDEDGIGAVQRYVWKTALPYTLNIDVRTTRVERPTVLELASAGELEGTGQWQLSEMGGITTVRYDWNVRTTKPWMNLFAPVARPAFAWNHAIVMRAGGEALARTLGVRLISNGEARREQAPRRRQVYSLAFGLAALALSAGLTYKLAGRRR